MSNFFDQFDELEQSAAPQKTTTQANFFDQFDEPARDPSEVNDQINAAMAERQAVKDRGFINNAVRGAGERAADLGGGLLNAAGAAAESAPKGGPAPGYVGQFVTPEQDATVKESIASTFADAADSARAVDLGYDEQRNTLDGAKAKFEKGDYLGSAFELWSAGNETMLTSAPDMAGAAGALPVYIAARTGEIANERAKNKGLDRPTQTEMNEAAPFAVASSLLERILPGRLIRGVGTVTDEAAKEISDQAIKHVLKTVGKEAGKDAAIEGGTEFIQEGVIEYIGQRYGTEASMDVREALAQGTEAAILGSIGGGTAGTARGTVDAATDILQVGKATPEPTQSPIEPQPSESLQPVADTAQPVIPQSDLTVPPAEQKPSILNQSPDELEQSLSTGDPDLAELGLIMQELDGVEAEAIQLRSIIDDVPQPAAQEVTFVDQPAGKESATNFFDQFDSQQTEDFQNDREAPLIQTPDVQQVGRNEAQVWGEEGIPEREGMRKMESELYSVPGRHGSSTVPGRNAGQDRPEGELRAGQRSVGNNENPTEQQNQQPISGVSRTDDDNQSVGGAYRDTQNTTEQETGSRNEHRGGSDEEIGPQGEALSAQGRNENYSADRPRDRIFGNEGVSEFEGRSDGGRTETKEQNIPIQRGGAVSVGNSQNSRTQPGMPARKNLSAGEIASGGLDKYIKENTNATPSEAQAEQGNYRKAHVKIQGLDISIENPRGSTRSGTDPDGNKWEVAMKSHYGYIRKTEGADGEHVDVFVGPNPDSDKVFVIDQVNRDGTFDEGKVMLGFDSKLKARSGYKANYTNGWKVGPITGMTMDEFKAWIKEGDTRKPLKPDHFAGAGKMVPTPMSEPSGAENVAPKKKAASPPPIIESKNPSPASKQPQSESAVPIGETPSEQQDSNLPAILTETKAKTLKRMAAEKRIKKGSPGYVDAMARLEDAYETEVDRAQASLPFEEFNKLNSETPESINRQAYNALREEFDLPLFSLGSDSGSTAGSDSAVSAMEANKVIRGITSKWITRGTEVELRDGFSALPVVIKESAKQNNISERDVKGVFHKGITYLVRENLKTPLDVEKALFHEAYGHYGLRLLFGQDTRNKMSRLYFAVGGLKGVKELADKYDIDLSKYQRKLTDIDSTTANSILVEELLAHIAEQRNSAERNWDRAKRWAKELIGAIRNWLRAHGFNRLSEASETDLFFLLRQARKAVVGTHGQVAGDDIRFMVGEAGIPPAETRKVIGDDAVLAGWTMLAQDEEVFRLPTSKAKTLAGVFADIEPGMIPERWPEMDSDGAKVWKINPDKDTLALVFEKGKSVWIDVADLKQGQGGNRIYNAVANYAFNTDKTFIGDPAGLSDKAVSRRLENMISSALKFGTTRHIWPHPKQEIGAAGVPGIKWKDGDDANNLREMIKASYTYVKNQFPGIEDLAYNGNRDAFFNVKTGAEVTTSELDEIVRAARGDRVRPEPNGRQQTPRERRQAAANSRSVDGPITAGRRTVERAILTHTLLRAKGGEVADILGRFSNERTLRLRDTLYSLGSESNPKPRPSAGVSVSGVGQTETAAFKKWFGDSKVVGENGKPLVVYHGTASDFSQFSKTKATDRDGRKLGMGWGKGKFYFAGSGMAASSSAEFAQMTNRGTSQNVMPVYLSIQNPIAADEYMNTVREGMDLGLSRDAAITRADKAIKKSGVDGIIDKDTGGFAVFEPTQIKSAIGNTGAFDPEDQDIRFSLAQGGNSAAVATRPTFAKPDDALAGFKFKSAADTILRVWADKFRPLLNTQREIQKATGQSIPEDVNAYLAEELFHGKTENDLRKMEERYIEPLTKKMAEYKIERDELDMYLWAVHAPERNKQIAKINPAMPDGGSGMTTKQAIAVLKQAQTEGKMKNLHELAQYVYGMLKQRREIMKGATMDDAMIDAWDQVYKFYVPLKGRAIDESSDKFPRAGKGFDIRGKETLRALGRRTKPESPVLHSIRDTTDTIIRYRKNEVGNVFLGLVQKYPNPDYWNVYTSESPELQPKLKTKDGKEFVGEGAVVNKNKYFITKKNGKEYFIDLKDEKLLRAMQNMGPEPLNMFMQLMGTASRFLSSMNTTYNPEFTITNFARDIQTAVINMLAEQDLHDGKAKGQEIATKMVKGVPTAVRAIHASLTGKQLKDTAADWQKMFDQFRDDGAKTGWFDMKDIDGQAKQLENLINMRKGNLKGRALRTKKAVGDFIENINGAIENGVRLSAYKAAVEAGISRKQAASLAKNLTVNFNRKGEIGQAVNSLYMFANASIQGTAAFARAIGTLKVDASGKRSLNLAQKVGIGIAASSFALALLNREMAGEDDDEENLYDKVPDYVKERNIVIMKSIVGGEPGEYWTIPLPYGYNIFNVIGTSAEAAAMGEKGVGEASANILKAFFGSFSPIGIAESDSVASGVSRTLAPTITKPFVDIAANENFFGAPVYRENLPFGAPKPESYLSKRSTPEAWKWAAEFINDATGGSEYRSGAIDVNPDKLDYVFDYLVGSSGAFVSRVADAIIKTAQGRELEAREIPFVRKVTGSVSFYPDQSAFYDRKDEIWQLEKEWKSLRGAERIAFYKEHGGKIRLEGRAKAVEKELKRLRGRRDAIEEDESLTEREKDLRLKLIEKQMKAKIDQFNKIWPD